MTTLSTGMPYGVGSTGSPWNAYDKSKLDELLAAKGGKLLTPDAFYKHPAKNIFGSYSTYVDWYAGGKKRKADERQLFRSASSGNWKPTDYGPVTAGTGAPIKAGGMATEGISGTDIMGRSTMSAPGVGQVPVDYNYRDQERIERERKRRYDFEYDATKRAAISPQDKARQDIEKEYLGLTKEERQVKKQAAKEKQVQDRLAFDKEKEDTKWKKRDKEIDKKFEHAKTLATTKDGFAKATKIVLQNAKHKQQSLMATVSQRNKLIYLTAQRKGRLADLREELKIKARDADSRAKQDMYMAELMQVTRLINIGIAKVNNTEALNQKAAGLGIALHGGTLVTVMIPGNKVGDEVTEIMTQAEADELIAYAKNNDQNVPRILASETREGMIGGGEPSTPAVLTQPTPSPATQAPQLVEMIDPIEVEKQLVFMGSPEEQKKFLFQHIESGSITEEQAIELAHKFGI